MKKTTNAVYYNGYTDEWFWTTVGIWQGCLLSLTLFNALLEHIITNTVVNHHKTVSISGRNLTILRYANDIDRLAGNEKELAHLVQCLDETLRAYGMEINVDKTKMMANAHGGTSPEVMVNGHALQRVKEFKYLGSIVSDGSSKPEVLARTVKLCQPRPDTGWFGLTKA